MNEATRDYGHTGRAGDPLTMQGPLVDNERGFIAAVYRNPLLWGAAIAFFVSGLAVKVTL